MKERLSYKVTAIDYGQQGQPPESKYKNWPGDAIYSSTTNQKLHLPEGMTKEHYDFLEDGVLSGTIDTINPVFKTVYLYYFTTNSSVKDLSHHFGSNSVTHFRHIKYAIRDIWKAMPESLKEKYDPDTIKKLKRMHGARKGFQRSLEEKEYLRRLGQERMTPEFRKIIGDAVSDSYTPAVRAKVRKKAIQISSTSEGKARLGGYGRQHGHRFTKEEARRINAKRFGSTTAELSLEERQQNPLEGAIFNLSYTYGKRFPADIKRFYRENPTVSYYWHPRERPRQPFGFLSYNRGFLWYNRGLIRVMVTADILTKIWNGEPPFETDRGVIEKFGRSSRSELRNQLRVRMDSWSEYFQQLRTTQYPS
ncbi:MAG: hypothetical protein A2171_01090 [Candidatus Levybacteria bacterium RBG_13_35_9]|nr:MAG: hypothetical protein A2171_01090 [Candidatus Levybacteria bacterium RBG_13_35_9]